MKKLMIAAAAMMAGVAMAEVESANIVGYETVTVPKGGEARIFSVQFENLADAKAIPIRSLVTYENPQSNSQKLSDANDQIWTYKGGTWQKYYYCSKNNANKGWHLDEDGGENIGPLLTAENDDLYSISAGDAFFFQRSNTIETETVLTLAGGVKPLAGQREYVVAGGNATLICNPWPLPIQINQFHNNYVNPQSNSQKLSDANDQIWTYKGGTWQKYYYCSKNNANKGWHLDEDGGENIGPMVEDTETIAPGEGFFFQRSNTIVTDTITINGPEYKAAE